MPIQNTAFPIINVPGGIAAYFPVQTMLSYGRQIRDEFVWCYPVLPGAVFTFQQLASNREWKLSGSKSGVTQANDWLHNAVSRQLDGLEFRGLDNFLRLRSLDYLAVGRRLFYAPEGGDLEYLDPCYTHYNMSTRKWQDNMTGRELPVSDVYVDHTLPLGSSGRFTSPLVMVIPSAMLAWLIREHDAASLDGRKAKDVILVRGQETAEHLKIALISMIQLHNDPSKAINSNNIPIVFTDMDGYDGPVQDHVGRLGLTAIPDGFDRQSFTFQFVNEISAATGLSLRHFWNQEQSTNRALEEIQQQRQAMKGPETFVRSEQRIFNDRRILRRFGPRTRLAFFEEVDAQTQLNRSQVLRNNAEAFKIFNEAAAANGEGLSMESLIAWQQSEGVLPHELSFDITTRVATSDPDHEVENVEESDPRVARLEKGISDLDYDEITINSNGDVIDSRVRIFPVHKLIAQEIEKDSEHIRALSAEQTPFDFNTALLAARKAQHAQFIEKMNEFSLEDPDRLTDFEKLTDSDFQTIDYLMNHHDA